MGRPRHPDKDLEQVLRSLEGQGWRVEKGKKYFKAKCGCEDRHLKTMHLTPSDPNYILNWTRHVARNMCWEDDR